MSTGSTICIFCRHYRPDGDVPSCAAFPGGVPAEIINGGFDHRQEYPGDGGIRFEPDGPVDQEQIDIALTKRERPEVR